MIAKPTILTKRFSDRIISESSFDMSNANYFPLNGMYPPWLFSILTTAVSAIVKAGKNGALEYCNRKM